MKRIRGIAMAALFLLGCGTTRMFESVPSSLDRNTVAKQTIDMTAEHFHFTPEIVRTKEGTLVTLRIHARDGTHGFALGAFGIDETIEESQTKSIEFYAAQKGEYTFKCSHFCGIGHLGMNGKIIVE